MNNFLNKYRILRCGVFGLLLFLIAFLLSIIISNFTIDQQIMSISAEDESPCYSKEFSIKDRIEYSFKNTILAEYAYDEAIAEKDEAKKQALFERAERNCKNAISFYPFENYAYVLLKKIYANSEKFRLTKDKECGIIQSRLNKIEDKFAGYYIKYYENKEVIIDEIE